MDEIAFTTQDFKDLESIDNFNKEHWTAGASSVGWNYDVEKTDPQIKNIRESLQRIKGKLAAIGEYLHSKDEYKDLEFGVQKITDGITVRYLSDLWMYFYKGLEKKTPNEPQLQLDITKENIHISLWFEKKSANEKYLRNFLEDYSDELKQDSQIQILLYGSGIGGKLIDTYKTLELEKFASKLSELNFDCKLGFQYIFPKDEVIKQGDKIVSTIEKYMNKMKQYFDMASITGKRFIVAHIEWNDFGWTQLQKPEDPSFGYTKDGNMPHETLNFNFDKPIDTSTRIYGYFQPGWGIPREFTESQATHKIIFFYSDKKIVGLYGNAEFLQEKKEYKNAEFIEGAYDANLSGDRDLSFGFLKKAYLQAKPEYLDDKRMGRSNFVYIGYENAHKIIRDAIAKYEEILLEEPENTEAKEHLEKLNKLAKNISINDSTPPNLRQDNFNLLLNKKEIILYGPPGTGKTYKTKEIAVKFLQKKI
jgi:hypothetical protein